MENMQADLEKINSIIQSVESSQDQVAFLKRSKEIRESMEQCIAKSINPNLDVYPEDLPQELIEIRKQMENKPGLDQLLNIKNEIIFKLISDKTGAAAIDSTAQGELEEWAKLTDKFAGQLQRFKCMGCEYCGIELSAETVNTNCPKNLVGENPGRHFFTNKPTKVEASFSPMKSVENLPVRSIIKDSAEREGDDSVLRALALACKENSVYLPVALVRHDAMNSGILDHQTFAWVLKDELSLNDSLVDQLASRYDITRQNRIQYKLLIADLDYAICIEGARDKRKQIKGELKKLDYERAGTVKTDDFCSLLQRVGINAFDIEQILKQCAQSEGKLAYPSFLSKIK